MMGLDMLEHDEHQAFDLLDVEPGDLFSLFDEQQQTPSVVKTEPLFCDTETFNLHELVNDSPSPVQLKQEIIHNTVPAKPIVTQSQVPPAFIDPNVFLQDFAQQQARMAPCALPQQIPRMPFFTPIQPPFMPFLHPVSPNTPSKASPPYSSSSSDNDTNNSNAASIKGRAAKRPHEEITTPLHHHDADSQSPTNDGEGGDTKRQKRLIKNRESAQASRERKKNYLQSLEKKVEQQDKTITMMQNKMLTLEEENRLLREKLLKLQANSGDLDALSKEAKSKAQRASSASIKVPIPPANSSAWLSNKMWTNFWQLPQLGPNGGLSNATRASVVLVLLFSFAIMFTLNGTATDFLGGQDHHAINTHIADAVVPDSPISATESIPDFEKITRKGRVLLSHDEPSVMLSADSKVTDQFKSFYAKLSKLIKTETEESVAHQNTTAVTNNETSPIMSLDSEEQQVYGSLKISLDETKTNLIVVLQPIDDASSASDSIQNTATKIKVEEASTSSQLSNIHDASSFFKGLMEGIEVKL